MGSITFAFPAIPESVNNLYFSKGGQRVLSIPGRKFKTSFVANRGGLRAVDLAKLEQLSNDLPYILELWFYLPAERLYNLTYGSDGRVKSPFQNIDTSNLIKLAEDSISDLTGLRDRNNWSVLAHKRLAEDGSSRMVARLSPLDLEVDPYPCL